MKSINFIVLQCIGR